MKVSRKKLAATDKVTILALSWRDIKAPKAGGAEVHTHEMLKRADKEKYRIYHFSPMNKNLLSEEEIDGVTYYREGNIFSVIFAAFVFYKKNKKNIDFVIDQCNTHRFFTPFWVEKKKRIFYIHQLTKEIWDYSAEFPLSKIGKVLEEWMLGLNRKDAVLTVSESTKQELVERGYQENRIKIIHNGISFEPWTVDEWKIKEKNPTFVYAGRYSPYKGIDVAICSFIRIKKEVPNAQFWILGKKNEEYVKKSILPICEENDLRWIDINRNDAGKEIEDLEGDIISWGYVSEEKKLELLSRAWALIFPSIREGWGIPITEAGSVGTPSIAYNSPGIREAVNYGAAGYLCKENKEDDLVYNMNRVICDLDEYTEKQLQAYNFSTQFVWDEVGAEFNIFIESLHKER